MARTLNEIYDQLTTNFVNNATIQQRYGLTPGQTFDQQFSKVSLEAALFHVVSYSIWILESLFDKHVTWINNRAKEIITGNTPWYARIALEYQHGDALVWNSDKGVYEYAEIDESIQIVKYAKAIDSSIVLIKVAKDNGGVPEKLDAAQLNALTAYMDKRKFAGVKLDIVSRDADELRVFYNVYYDPLVMNADGSLISDPSIFPVEDTIRNYIKNLPFDGRFNITELTDNIQLSEGAVNPIFQNCAGKSGTQTYQAITDYYSSNAGYMVIDANYPLSNTITYIAAQ
jgi:hypothetical protein